MAADRLAASTVGAGTPLVLVHGFTQTGASWAPVVDRLGPGFRVTTLDAPGHGGSSSIAADLPRSGDLVVEAGGAATYVGYSMGARICLHAALQHPDQVERLVLVSGTAGIDDADDRAQRRADDEDLAEAIQHDGVDAFLERWLALPMFATLPAAAAGIDERRSNRATGLASSLRLAGTGTQQPLWGRLGELTMPVWLVAGGADQKFVGLTERMARLLPNAESVTIVGAGHTVHLERPDEFTTMLVDWLRRPS